ncbi:tRNA (guanine(9)-N1)-methyltransferase [Vanrija pseudolonga]|uniref:tRNA (guanine(9)-N1)-methyltransferase n=1 Tax=Vanrija pseudolonga TaxID=143232 RepID=A0AAF1BLJ9_9TREE|nr:tRNA (guanine(9)-N1)-methyltransferase [Vanrija pseudolonga]
MSDTHDPVVVAKVETPSLEAAPSNEEATAPTDIAAEAGPSTPPLSKNQQKKLAKRAKFESHKLEKRAAERIRRRERTQALKAGYEAGTLSEADKEIYERGLELKRRAKANVNHAAEVWPGGVVIDCGFDELMTEQEITSMSGQLTYVYSANRTAPRPFSSVLFTSFSPEISPRLWEKMTKTNWDRWNRMHFWSQDVGVLAGELGKEKEEGGERVEAEAEGAVESATENGNDAAANGKPARPKKTKLGANGAPNDTATLLAALSGPHLPPTLPATHKLVYLSADADEELTTLAEDEVYVLGGIVDRNRHKMLCQNKADKLNIRTARLPIGTFIENLPTRKVLTVNQVYSILVQYVALQDWAAAFEAVIPQRKFFGSKQERKASKRKAEGTPDVEGDGGDDVAEEGDEEEREDGDDEHILLSTPPMDVDHEEAVNNALA